MRHLLGLFLTFALSSILSSQSTDLAKSMLLDKIGDERRISLELSSKVTTNEVEATHYYFVQTINDIPIHNAISGITLNKSNAYIYHTNRTFDASKARQLSTKDYITVDRSIELVNRRFELSGSSSTDMVGSKSGFNLFQNNGLSKSPILSKLVYLPKGNELILCRTIAFEHPSTKHWHVLMINSDSGQIESEDSWTHQCSFDTPDKECTTNHKDEPKRKAIQSNLLNTASYNVIPVPFESPSETDLTLVTDPWNDSPNASEFGWHDLDGMTGAETTTTRGNNVWATEDTDGDDDPGDSPDGGAGLVFDFDADFSTNNPSIYQDAAITNLFYWNNIVHDVLYECGFDEASGNFQDLNYTNAGLGSDFVFADAQDGSGTNNATFSTPPDGVNPRMTMFRWEINSVGNSNTVCDILSPASIAGLYDVAQASFGQQTRMVSGEIELADDGVGVGTDACEDLGVGTLTGKVAMVDRGSCAFTDKVKEAQQAGAVAVMICNNDDSPIFSPGGSAFGIGIPSLMISKADCDLIKVELNNGTVTVDLDFAPADQEFLDSDYDNGIIAHEYGHGWSIRLTGGPAESGCLNTSEQMGEGWSDYLGAILTIKENETGAEARGIGTYVINQDSLGSGIRPHPYSTDLTINPHTYNDIANESIPHGVGSVWAAMLWDMTWLLIDQYGFDPDIYAGTGGNNIALKLVTQGLKLQPCGPGFVDGRDAILAADNLLYAGANQCVIWEAFSKRGLGDGASQGDPDNVNDGTESFDMPSTCFGCTDSQATNYNPLAGLIDDGSCIAQSCTDGIMNRDETGVDCGGAMCEPCHCSNGLLDGDEQAIDCGGSCSTACCNGSDIQIDGVFTYAFDEEIYSSDHIKVNSNSSQLVDIPANRSIKYQIQTFLDIDPLFEVKKSAQFEVIVGDCKD